MSSNNHYLIIPASGIGSRMHSNISKQYIMLDNGLSVLDQTLTTLLNIKQIKGWVIAIANKDSLFKQSIFHNHPKLLAVVQGGKQRSHSVSNALEALKPFAKDNDWVLVHDASRPCVSALKVIQLINQLKYNNTGGLLASKIIDTIKHYNNDKVTTIDRTNLWQAQTPQMYRFRILSKALKTALKQNINITDEASAIEHIGLQSTLIESNKSNIKITNPKDLKLANFYLK